MVPQHGFCLLRKRLRIFDLTQLSAKAISNKFYTQNLSKDLWGKGKRLLFLRYHNGSRDIFVNTGKGNWVFIFLILLPKRVYIYRLKIWKNIEIKFLFHLNLFWCALMSIWFHTVSSEWHPFIYFFKYTFIFPASWIFPEHIS